MFFVFSADEFSELVTKSGSTVNMASIKRVMEEQGCHCVLDISPQSVQWLNTVGLNPIVIFFKPDSNKHVKDVRASFKSAKVPGASASHKQLYRVAIEVERNYSHLFSGQPHSLSIVSLVFLPGGFSLASVLPKFSSIFVALAVSHFSEFAVFTETIHLSANNVWYAKLTDTIKKHQATQIWMAEFPVRLLFFLSHRIK